MWVICSSWLDHMLSALCTAFRGSPESPFYCSWHQQFQSWLTINCSRLFTLHSLKKIRHSRGILKLCLLRPEEICSYSNMEGFFFVCLFVSGTSSYTAPARLECAMPLRMPLRMPPRMPLRMPLNWSLPAPPSKALVAMVTIFRQSILKSQGRDFFFSQIREISLLHTEERPCKNRVTRKQSASQEETLQAAIVKVLHPLRIPSLQSSADPRVLVSSVQGLQTQTLPNPDAILALDLQPPELWANRSLLLKPPGLRLDTQTSEFPRSIKYQPLSRTQTSAFWELLGHLMSTKHLYFILPSNYEGTRLSFL